MNNRVTATSNQQQDLFGLLTQYAGSITATLPAHLNEKNWFAGALNQLRQNPYLVQVASANAASLFAALRQAASRGLALDNGHFYLVPFGREVTGVISYTGIMDMMYRSGQVSSVVAELVYENDTFDFNLSKNDGFPDHTADWFGDRGALIGGYAYAISTQGKPSKVVTKSKADFDATKAKSKGAAKPSSPWNTSYEAMCLKTLVRRLVPWVPQSVADVRLPQVDAVVRHVPELPAHLQLAAGAGNGLLEDGTESADPETGEITAVESAPEVVA